MKLHLYVCFTIVLLLSNAHAQQKGTYLTSDQTKEITLLDSNRIFIKETDFKKNFEEIIITGTFRRKLKRLLVYPDSYVVDGKPDDENKPELIVFKLKDVTGQKFMIKRIDHHYQYEEYYLRLYP